MFEIVWQDFFGRQTPVFLAALAYSALGLLPALIIQLKGQNENGVIRGKFNLIMLAAYGLSVISSVMQFSSAFSNNAPSVTALKILATGYFLILAFFLFFRKENLWREILHSTALFIFIVSLLHLSFPQAEGHWWLTELVGHQASLPLILAILYQNFRFAFADLFLKRAISLVLLAALVVAGQFGIAAPLAALHNAHPGMDSAKTGVSSLLWMATALLYPQIHRFSVWLVDKVLLKRRNYNSLKNEIMQKIATLEPISAVLTEVKNELAHELERLAAKLEIGETDDSEGSRLARDYFAERRAEASDEAEELPEHIRKYLVLHHNDLDALYSFGRQNSRPEWETDVSLRAKTPSPNLSFHIRLHEIIALDALNRIKESQNRQALEAFEASRKASEFFRERPEADFQMINLLVTSTQNYALRKMNDDYRRLASKVLEHEYAAANLLPDSESSTTLQKLTDKIFPFSQFNSALDTSEAVRETVAEWQRRDFCSRSNLNGESKLAWWNTGGRIVFPAALQIWRNFAELSYDAELTERVLRLKEFRRASPQSDLPPELSRMKSALCDGADWTVESSPTVRSYFA